MKLKNKYVWKFNSYQLEIFKLGLSDYPIFSNNFNNNCWCMFVKGSEDLFWFLKVIKLPYDVTELCANVSIKIESDCHSVESKGMCEFGYDYSKAVNNWVQKINIKSNLFSQAKYLSITVFIEIIDIMNKMNKNDQKIPNKMWKSLGFLQDDNSQ